MENTTRFNGRALDYSRYRPEYPEELYSILQLEFGITEDSVIVDVGAGTGKLSSLFLKHGNKVFSVEPNADMRETASKDLEGHYNSTILDGTAENTGLDGGLADLVVAGQAFHWFDPEKAREEFRRILRKDGAVALVWNDRVESRDGINAAYEKICRKYSNGYSKSGSGAVSDEVIAGLFGKELRRFSIPNPQKMNLETFKGRYFSASYSLGKDHPDYRKLVRALGKAFRDNKKGEYVSMEYTTKVYSGKLA